MVRALLKSRVTYGLLRDPGIRIEGDLSRIPSRIAFAATFEFTGSELVF